MFFIYYNDNNRPKKQERAPEAVNYENCKG